MNNPFEYRDKFFFEEGVEYEFKDNLLGVYRCGVHLERGYHWTNEPAAMPRKATTIPCRKIG